jgi:putative ABC transport system permease protein
VGPRLSSLGLSPTRQAEISEELSQHLDDRYRELLAAGVSPEDAVRQTVLDMPAPDAFISQMSTLRQAHRADCIGEDSQRFPFRAFSMLRLDLRYTLRGLRKDWGFTAAVVLSLALGIGTNAAVFTAAHAILLRPLPFEDSDRLAHVWLSRVQRPDWHFHVPPADFAVIAASNHVFDGLALYDTDPVNITGGGAPEEVTAGFVSAALFHLLRVQPLLGRSFDASDEEPGGTTVAILSEGLWRRRFGGDPGVLGANVSLNDRAYRIVGVMPAGREFPPGAALWLPRDRSDTRSNAYIVGRLHPGVGLGRAQADMESMVTAITNGRPNPGMKLIVEPVSRTATKTAQPSWLLFLGAVACVFGIGCLNISNLLMARGLRRRSEMSLRLALGGTPVQIVRLLATESLLLAGAAGVLAPAVAIGVLRLIRMWTPADTPRLQELGIAPLPVAVAIGVSTLTAFCLGLIPALRFSPQGAPGSAAVGGALSTVTRAHSLGRDALVVAQIALALVLLMSAALLLRSFGRLTAVDVGFRTEHLLTVSVHLPPSRYATAVQQLDFLTVALGKLRSLPGALSATASSGSVMTGLGLPGAQRTLAQRIAREGVSGGSPPEEANLRRVDTHYFRTMDMQVIAGRGFADTDRASMPLVAVVNRTMARAFWGTEEVIGKRLSYERIDGKPQWLDIVGVVNDTRDIALTEAPLPSFFVPILQNRKGVDGGALTLYIRTSDDPLKLADGIRAQIWAVDPTQPLAEMSTMELAIDRFVAPHRLRTGLLTGMAVLGLVLALTGIYAVISYAVNQRTPEMAVRVALGASRWHIASLVLRHGLNLAALGIGIGLATCVAGARLVASLLFGVGLFDPITFLTVPFLVLMVVMAGCYIPAARAAGVDPIRALRGDGA